MTSEKTYYLQESLDGNRMMIDTEVHAGFLLTRAGNARFWIEAKKLFGFELTGLQEYLFETKLAAHVNKII